VPLGAISLRTGERTRTFIRRIAQSLTPKLQVRLAWAFADGYMGGAVQSAWERALAHHDLALADEARSYALNRDWLP
jgi:hypothetical protein